MPIRTLIQIERTGGGFSGNEMLRSSTELVTDFDDPELHELVQDLLDTMAAHPICVGLAAPQIGSRLRVAVAQVSDDEQIVLINPEIRSTSGKKDIKRESCMSVWGHTGPVQRRDKVHVSFHDVAGNTQELNFKGFPARIIQHEVDHLDGVVFSDYVDDADLVATSIFDDESPTAPTPESAPGQEGTVGL